MKQLLAGPWIGEFGWEIAVWVPVVRALSRKYDETIVLAPASSFGLYQDFADTMFEHRASGRKDRWLCGGQKAKMPEHITSVYPNADVRRPRKRKCLHWDRLTEKPYSGVLVGGRHDVLLHIRDIPERKDGDRNWSVKEFVKLIKMLRDNHPNIRIATIGGNNSRSLMGIESLNNVALPVLMGHLSRAKVCVGTSSGPMHLASFCGCPHVVFSDSKFKKVIGGTNRHRYERLWNPLKTPVTVLDKWDWHPPVSKVLKAVEGYLV